MSQKSSGEILRYFHCRRCHTQKPANQSMNEYARLEVGFTKKGVQVWCTRHRMEVGTVTPAELQVFIDSPPNCECCPGGRHVN